MLVVDIKDPASPYIVSEIATCGEAKSVVVSDDLLAVTNYPRNQMNPEIWENRVVWADYGMAEACTDIYWCELPDCIAHLYTNSF